jgi:hypothetical protein
MTIHQLRPEADADLTDADVTPIGVALADVLEDELRIRGLSIDALCGDGRRLYKPHVHNVLNGKSGSMFTIEALERALQLPGGELLRRAGERSVPIVCPPWCAKHYGYSGDGVMCHYSASIEIGDHRMNLAVATNLDGTPLDDCAVTFELDGDDMSLRTAVLLEDAIRDFVSIASLAYPHVRELVEAGHHNDAIEASVLVPYQNDEEYKRAAAVLAARSEAGAR